MNYFEMLGVSETETSEQVLGEAYQRARVKWQTLLTQGIGEQQRQARQVMNGELENAYETLSDPTLRQQYLRQLKLAQETGIPLTHGRVRVSFTLANGHADHDFLVVDNPVRHALETADGLTIGSIQEYVCRAWEDPEMAGEHLADRTLERWLYYAAAEAETAEAIQYLRWEQDGSATDSPLYMVLDLLQSKYPAPILPCSPPSWGGRLPALLAPQWRVAPAVANFGVLTAGAPTSLALDIRSWQQPLGEVAARAAHPAVKVDVSQLAAGRLGVAIQAEALARGELLETAVEVLSAQQSCRRIPVLAARPNLMLGNRELADRVNQMAGEAAMAAGDLRAALRYFRVAQAQAKAAEAARALVRRAYERHDWLGVVQMGRYYKDHHGRDDEVQLWLVEALRVLAGSIYQLGEHRRSLEHLASLAMETAQLADRKGLANSWTAQASAQLRLNLADAKADWVDLAEHYDLNWTHAAGRADGSRYVGPVPLDLSARRVVWKTTAQPPLKAPILAYEGMLLARRRDGCGVVALDAASGRQAWGREWGRIGQESAMPVAGEGCFFVTDPMGELRALDALTGKARWKIPLEDNRHVSLAYGEGVLYVGTGRRLSLFEARTGERLAATDEMKAFFGWVDADPVNVLITDGCCLFQKAGGFAPTLVFADIESGSMLEFQSPFTRSWVSTLVGSLFAGPDWVAAAWAAYAGEVYVPYLITKEIECRSQYRDSNGQVRDQVERKSWGELHFFVYHVRQDTLVAHVWETVWGTAYKEKGPCQVSIKEVRAADVCAVAPAHVEIKNDTNYVDLPRPGKPPHRLIAAGFGRDVYYWISTDRIVKRVGYRGLDSDVQSLAYLGLYDLATTARSLSTSFLGSTKDGDATLYGLEEEIGGAAGAPAIYGDVIYLLTRAGSVAALGR